MSLVQAKGGALADSVSPDHVTSEQSLMIDSHQFAAPSNRNSR